MKAAPIGTDGTVGKEGRGKLALSLHVTAGFIVRSRVCVLVIVCSQIFEKSNIDIYM